MVEAVILSQGDELTTGQTIDGNSHWLAGRLWELGLPVRRICTVPDRLDELVEVLRQAATLAPVVVGTGGLGPTRDDLTAEAVARAFDLGLVENSVALEQIRAFFARHGRRMSTLDQKQALLPLGARVLENRWGTAPGFAVDLPQSTLYLLPGVPDEAQRIFAASVAPDIVARHTMRPPVVHTVRCVGVPESVLEDKMRRIHLPNLSIGFRTARPEVHVKLRFPPGVPEADRRRVVDRVRALVGWRAFGVDTGPLAEVVGERLAERGETLAVAESCTGGLLAATLTAVPGASRYLMEGAVVYANTAKTRTAGVPESMIAEHGAVSAPVARQLAEGIRQRAHTTWGVGITGIAGPSGGTPDKPVGTVHLALAGPTGTTHRHLTLPGDRARIQALTVGEALAMLFRALTEPR